MKKEQTDVQSTDFIFNYSLRKAVPWGSVLGEYKLFVPQKKWFYIEVLESKSAFSLKYVYN